MRARKKHAREPWKKIYGNLEPRVYFIVVHSPRTEVGITVSTTKKTKKTWKPKPITHRLKVADLKIPVESWINLKVYIKRKKVNVSLAASHRLYSYVFFLRGTSEPKTLVARKNLCVFNIILMVEYACSSCVRLCTQSNNKRSCPYHMRPFLQFLWQKVYCSPNLSIGTPSVFSVFWLMNLGV